MGLKMKTRDKTKTVGEILDDLRIKLKRGIEIDKLKQYLTEYPSVFGRPDDYIEEQFRRGVMIIYPEENKENPIVRYVESYC